MVCVWLFLSLIALESSANPIVGSAIHSIPIKPHVAARTRVRTQNPFRPLVNYFPVTKKAGSPGKQRQRLEASATGKTASMEPEDPLNQRFLNAIFTGDASTVKQLVDSEINVWEYHKIGSLVKGYPLHEAVKRDEEEIVDILLNEGIELVRDSQGKYPIDYADIKKNRKIKLRLNQIDICEDVKASRTDSLNQKLQEGTELNGHCPEFGSPLHNAAAMGAQMDTALVQLLLNAGADANSLNHFGQTPLRLAIITGSMPKIELLMPKTKIMNNPDAMGDTLLHTLMKAPIADKKNLASMLLQQGANPDLKNAKGQTAADVLKQETDQLIEVLDFYSN